MRKLIPPPDPNGTDFDQFTDAELQSCFAENRDVLQKEIEGPERNRPPDGGQLSDDLLDAMRALWRLNIDFYWSSDNEWEFEFSRLSREVKLMFIRGWHLLNPMEPAAIEQPTDADTEWATPEYAVGVTLPDGTQMTEFGYSDPD